MREPLRAQQVLSCLVRQHRLEQAAAFGLLRGSALVRHHRFADDVSVEGEGPRARLADAEADAAAKERVRAFGGQLAQRAGFERWGPLVTQIGFTADR